MSKTVDQRVVEMRFDNKHFEKNAKQTLSTLDKLKMKLNLSGASKGLDNLSKSASKVNMNPLSNALSNVSSRFSAMEVIGVTALANIANSAVEAGKRLIESITIAPVKDGFSEYELMLNAIQTTMAGTGLTAKEVEEQLKQLDEYADKTVYSTADMLNNLPKFTNAGVELEVATKAMIGIANATAHAGGDANKASIAFYNLGQAIGTGYLTRMDYNSINNAGIATMRWKEAMVEAALEAGTLKEVEEGLYDTGGHVLTLQQLFIDGLQDQWASTDVLLKVLGDYGDETTEIGKEAYSSAQKIKTFTMMMDSLKATAGTGWKDTWQIIFGDLDEATAFWSGINDFISGIINRIADFRNKLLGGALGKTFAGLFEGIKQSAEIAKEAVEPLLNYAELVDDIISGSWGNAPTRWEELAAAGYDWAHAQNLVNEKLGSSVRHATNYAKAQEKIANSQEKVTKATTDYILELLKMSDAELKALGFTDKQIKAFRELERASKKSGISLRYWIDNIDEIDGRWILLKSFENAFGAVKTVLESVGKAWKETIGTIESSHLYDFILALHKLSTLMVISDETADKLKRTFKGLFAVLDMVITLTTGPLMLLGRIVILFLQAIKVLPQDFLGITAKIGDYLVKLRDWMDDLLDATNVFEMLMPYLQLMIKGINSFFDSIVQSSPFQKFLKGLSDTKTSVIAWMNGMLKAKDIPKYMFEGLMNGLKKGVPKVFEFIVNFAKGILTGIKKVLRIESPSKEFYEIGMNIMQGLFNGIKNFVTMVYTLVMSVGEQLISIIQSMDLGSIFTMAISGGMIFAFVKIARAIEILANPLESLNDLLDQSAKVMKKVKGLVRAAKIYVYAQAIKTLAVGIAILAGAVAVLSLLNQGKVWSAVGAIGALIVLLGALTTVVGIFGKDKGLELGKITLSLIGMAFAVTLMAGALRKLSKIEDTKVVNTFGMFVGIIFAMLALMFAVSLNEEELNKAGLTLLAIGASFYLIAIAIKKFSNMKWGEMAKAGAALGAIVVALVALMWATQLLNRYSKPLSELGGILLSVGGAMLMIAIACKMFGRMEWEELGKAGAALGGLVVSMFILIVAMRIFKSNDLTTLGKTLLGVAGAMFLLAITAKMLASMEWPEMGKAGAALLGLVVFIVILITALNEFEGSHLYKVGATILTIAVAIGILAASAALLGMIDPIKLLQGVVAVGVMVYAMKVLIESTKKAKNIMSTLIPLTVAIGILALSLGLLSIIKWDKLLTSTAAMVAVMGMFALVIKAASNVSGNWVTLLTLTAAIGGIALAIGLLAKLPTENLIAAAGSISMVLAVLAGVMFLLSASGSISDKALMGVLGIMALCIPLYMILEVLTKMDKLDNAAENAMALSVFMGVLALVNLACAAVGAIYASTAGIAATGLLGMVALIGTIYLLLGALAIMNNIPDAVTNLKVLSHFMILMTGVLTVLAIVGPLALIGVSAMAALTALIVALGALGVGVGYLLEEVPNLEKFLNKGIPVLIMLAGALGDMIGAFIGGVIEGVSNTLPTLGQNLSDFINNAQDFITGAKLIDSSVLKGITTLAGAILLITATDLIEGVASWLTGDKSLENFGKDIGKLGTSMKTFVANLGTFTPDQVTTVQCACDAISALANASKNVPGEGGWWQKIVGGKDIDTFGKKLPDLGTNLKDFVTNLGTFTPDQVATVKCAGDAVTALGEASKNMPAADGWWQVVVGGKDLETFGNKLPLLGTNLKDFVANLGTFNSDQVATVQCAGDAVSALADASTKITAEGGWWQKLVGGKDLETFGSKLPTLGTNLKDFVVNLGTFNKNKVDTVKSAVSVIQSFAKLGEINLPNLTNNLGAFGSKTVSFAKKIKSFVSEIQGLKGEDVSSAITKTTNIISMATDVSYVDLDALKALGSALKKFAKDGIAGFVKEFTSIEPKTQVNTAAKELVAYAIKGINSKKTQIKNSTKSIVSEVVKTFKSKTYQDVAFEAGKNLVKGFALGINNNRYLATNAAFTMGSQSVDALNRGIDSNSPSKESMKSGNYFGQGFIIGINDYASNVYKSAYGIGEEAKSGLSRAIARVSAIINNDMDSQPTIRPVLDLSDVESGIGSLNGMFNNGPSLGVSTNLRAIATGINTRNQNGSNGDVVSAINKLSKELGNVGGTTNNYNVNGVTYDDGSNLSDAVRTIIRAAKVERRI